MTYHTWPLMFTNYSRINPLLKWKINSLVRACVCVTYSYNAVLIFVFGPHSMHFKSG